MRHCGTKWLFSAMVFSCLAQEGPVDVIRGELLSWSGTNAGGELVIRDAENRVYQCSYDERSYFARFAQRIPAASIRLGDRIGVLFDRKPDSGIYYARTVEVEETVAAKAPAVRRTRAANYQTPVDVLAPRGDITLAGVVLKVSSDEMLVRTRKNERKTILLRADTSFLGGGQALEQSNLAVNTRVYIRAGRNLSDQVEAYQVVWGDILEPVAPPRLVP